MLKRSLHYMLDQLLCLYYFRCLFRKVLTFNLNIDKKLNLILLFLQVIFKGVQSQSNLLFVFQAIIFNEIILLRSRRLINYYNKVTCSQYKKDAPLANITCKFNLKIVIQTSISNFNVNQFKHLFALYFVFKRYCQKKSIKINKFRLKLTLVA